MERDASNQGFPHLYLSEWPFRTVPDDAFTKVWADRQQVKEHIDRLLWRWSRVENSTIHLVWADLGAGKTHTLKHIRQRCLDQRHLGIIPIYAVMPKQLRSFLEVYQAIMANLDLNALAEAFARVYRATSERKLVDGWFSYVPDAISALRMMQSDRTQDRLLATEWLRGTKFARRGLDTLGVTRYVRTTDEAVAIVSGLTRLGRLAGQYRRIVVMLDECQRIGNFKLAVGRDINIGLQTWYDEVSIGLTLVLSFGSGEEKFVRHLLSPELQSREDHLRVSMPLLSKSEAVNFVQDLLNHFRCGDVPSPWFPWTRETVEAVIGHIDRDSGVTPRVLMKAFDALLTEADFQIANGGQFAISSGEAIKLVENSLRGWEDEVGE